MLIMLSKVCAEFHEPNGRPLFTIKPNDLLKPIMAPDSIRQDPLFAMLVHGKDIEVVEKKEDLKRMENDPDKLFPESAEEPVPAAPAAKPAGRKSAEKKQ